MKTERQTILNVQDVDLFWHSMKIEKAVVSAAIRSMDDL